MLILCHQSLEEKLKNQGVVKNSQKKDFEVSKKNNIDIKPKSSFFKDGNEKLSRTTGFVRSKEGNQKLSRGFIKEGNENFAIASSRGFVRSKMFCKEGNQKLSKSISFGKEANKNARTTSFVKEGYQQLAPLPHRLNTLERVKEDSEFQRIFSGKYKRIYQFIPCGNKTVGSAIGNLYYKKHTNPQSKKCQMSRWLGKIGWSNMLIKGKTGSYFSTIFDEKTHSVFLKISDVVMELIASNLFRLLGDATFETTKMRLSELPIENEYTINLDVVRDKYLENYYKSKKSLRIMSKWCENYHDLCELFVKYDNEVISFMKFIEKTGKVPEKVIEPTTKKEVEIFGLMGVLATSTSLADIDVFGATGKNTGYAIEKNDQNEILSIRVVKIDSGMAFNYEYIRDVKRLRNVKDIRFCSNSFDNHNSFSISWNKLSEKQKNEFLEVKLHHLEVVKSPKIFEYIFFREGKFSHQMSVEDSKKLIKQLINHIKNEGLLFLEELNKYKKIRVTTILKDAMERKNKGDYDRSLCNFEKVLDFLNEDELSSKKNVEIYGMLYGEISKIELLRGNINRSQEFSMKQFSMVENSENSLNLANNYHNMARIFKDKGESDKSIEFYEKCLHIQLKFLPQNHPDIATTYSNIGVALNDKGEFDRAIEFYEKSLIIQESIPKNNLSIATIYGNIGATLHDKGEFDKAIEYYEKSLEIKIKSLPKNHPLIATSYNNIGLALNNKGEFNKSIEFYEKCLEIQIKSLPKNHPSIATSYNNIGLALNDKGEFDKSIEFYEKSLEIQIKSLPENHPSIATSFSNIGSSWNKKGEFDKAIEFYEKSLEIQKKSLPENHPEIATSYGNIGAALFQKGEFKKAIELNEKSLEIKIKSLPKNHPSIAASYSNIGVTYLEMGLIDKGIEFNEKAHEILIKSLPKNHPNVKVIENNLNFARNLKNNVLNM